MKALSLWQPWATLMAIGAKRVETRSWATTHRGPLAIHAAQKWTKVQRDMCNHPRFRKALTAAGLYAPDLLPRGAVLCVVDVVDCVSTNGFEERRIRLDELAFGDYERDRFAWVTDNLITLRAPLSIPGRQGLFELDARATAGVLDLCLTGDPDVDRHLRARIEVMP